MTEVSKCPLNSQMTIKHIVLKINLSDSQMRISDAWIRVKITLIPTDIVTDTGAYNAVFVSPVVE